MNLELRKATDGTHFVICVISERAAKQLVIPLSPELSDKIEQMVFIEGLEMDTAFVDPHLRDIRHFKLS